MIKLRISTLLATTALILAACGGTGTSASPSASLPTSVGEGEGALTVLAWPGYAEDGSTQPDVDWVQPFEKATGCQVDVTTFGTSDEAYRLFTSGSGAQFDVISASGDASLRLVAGGNVQAVNTDLVPNYADIFPSLKDKPWNTVNGVHYGIAHGRGANLLMWRTDKVTTDPDSWGVVFDENSPYKGKVTAYDAPIYIADAAVYLMATRPDLKITNPYALDQAQFDASVALMKKQRPLIGEYWSDYTKEIEAFTNGNSVLGTSWQIIANLLQAQAPPAPVKAIEPKEGATGWSDTWMINSKTKHLNCAYKWLNDIVSPKVNAQVAEWFGEAPANQKSCDLTADKNHCAIFQAAETDFWKHVYYWTTPTKTCLDGRGDVCIGFDKWIEAWTEIKG
ncbi:MAG: ABC transporter substrate-binding protein [Chloroflexota bacterium]|nr:ABC transporter substrate-binding protein [Chloroflexota bacterium]